MCKRILLKVRSRRWMAMAVLSLLIIPCSLFIGTAGAQDNIYLFKTLDAKDGLTSSQINCILKAARQLHL